MKLVKKNKLKNKTLEIIQIPENNTPVLYTECWCNSPYHNLRWHLNNQEVIEKELVAPVDLSFEIYLNPCLNFWGRIKNAIKYIFNNKYTHCGYDEFTIKQEDVKKLKSLCEQQMKRM